MSPVIRLVEVELLRRGPRHNQLLSPLTDYLAVCADFPGGVVNVPYEQSDAQNLLDDLRYTVASSENVRPSRYGARPCRRAAGDDARSDPGARRRSRDRSRRRRLAHAPPHGDVGGGAGAAAVRDVEGTGRFGWHRRRLAAAPARSPGLPHAARARRHARAASWPLAAPDPVHQRSRRAARRPPRRLRTRPRTVSDPISCARSRTSRVTGPANTSP